MVSVTDEVFMDFVADNKHDLVMEWAEAEGVSVARAWESLEEQHDNFADFCLTYFKEHRYD